MENEKWFMERMSAAAAEAEAELDGLEEQAVKLLRDWALRHKNKAGYKRLGMVLCGHSFRETI